MGALFVPRGWPSAASMGKGVKKFNAYLQPRHAVFTRTRVAH